MSAHQSVLNARRVVSGTAALGLAAGLVAVGAAPAGATARTVASKPTAGSVTSTVQSKDGDLSVRSTVGAAAENTYVESAVRGKVTVACFKGSRVVGATKKSIGWITTGNLDSAPWYSSGSNIDVVAEPVATKATVVAPVGLRGILRDRAGELSDLDCAAGTTAGFYHYWITSVDSTRYTFTGVATGTFHSDQHHTYAFPAPSA